MTTLTARAAALLAVVAGVLALASTAASPAAAQSFEQIRRLDVDIVVDGDGSMTVRETIEYDFGSQQRHGIFRNIPVRYRYDDTYDRVYDLDVIAVEGSPGTPVQYETDRSGDEVVLKIGDPDTTITGVHTYTIRYRVQGAMNAFEDHDELFWNAIGTQWSVPVEESTTTILMPGQVQKVACFSGPVQSQLPCTNATSDGPGATFTQDRLNPFEAFTIVLGVAKGVIRPEPTPILEERWSITRAFTANPSTLGATSGLLGLIILGFGLLAWRVGRDRKWLGSEVDVAFGGPPGETAAEEPVPLGGFGETPVEFEPPDKLRPGLLGTLVDETANPLDVTASIIDLAVRGYLRIEEIPKEGWFGKPDWRLVRLDKDDVDLRQYEQLLLGGLFSGGDGTVLLSELKQKFAARLQKVQNALYDDVVKQGWFVRRPDNVRTMWLLLGMLVLLAGIGLVVLAAIFTHLALIPIPIAIGGLLLVIGAHWMPRRTAKGTAVLRRALGFRRFIEESEKDRAQFAERQNLFSEYLPYAVVFGATEKWARAFSGLGDALPQQSWYVSSQPFTLMAFSSSMDSFAVTTSGTISSVPASSGGSGFSGGGSSGGGGGGGGGGSW